MNLKTDIKDIRIGNAQDEQALTGVTVILCEQGAVCGVDVRGGAPGTRETDLLDPVNTVDKVHAVVLSGGSAFGLATSTGVMRYLEERAIGFDTGVAKVPIVTQAVIFDLYLGNPGIRPTEAMGYQAAISASDEFAIGNAGGGMGATVGKCRGPAFAMKSGLGYHEHKGADGLIVGALVVVNAMGDIYRQGEIIAGALTQDKTAFLNTSKFLLSGETTGSLPGTNTTIGAVITNAKLTKAQAKKIAQTAHNGYARAIIPVHTSMDGDTIFALGTGEVEAPIDRVAHLGAVVMEKAIHTAVMESEALGGLSSHRDIR